MHLRPQPMRPGRLPTSGWLALAALAASVNGCARLDDAEPTATWKIVIGVVSAVYLIWKLRGWLGGAGRGGDGGGIDGFGGDGGDCG